MRPDLVYVAISPFGQEGPYAHHLASDLTLSAMGGAMAIVLFPALGLIRVAKVAEKGTEYSLETTAVNALYLVVSRDAKYKAKAVIVSTKDGQEKRDPIEFRKVGGGWKIELPMDLGKGPRKGRPEDPPRIK